MSLPTRLEDMTPEQIYALNRQLQKMASGDLFRIHGAYMARAKLYLIEAEKCTAELERREAVKR